MINKIVFTLLAITCTCITDFAQTSSQIVGKWETEDESKALQMEIYLARDGNYYGKVINDNSNPSKNGTLAIKSLKYNEIAKTYIGSMTPPDAGVTLNVTVIVESPNRLKLVARKLLVSKTMYLIRLK